MVHNFTLKGVIILSTVNWLRLELLPEVFQGPFVFFLILCVLFIISFIVIAMPLQLVILRHFHPWNDVMLLREFLMNLILSNVMFHHSIIHNFISFFQSFFLGLSFFRYKILVEYIFYRPFRCLIYILSI